jgi:hypothetical protein
VSLATLPALVAGTAVIGHVIVDAAPTTAVTGPLTDAQLRASAVPVSGTFFQATQPVSGTVTSNAGTNLNTSALALEAGHLATIDTSTAKIPSQGQALAGASMPVVLPATQITTLTPPAAITGFALEAGHLATIDTSTAKIPSQGQALAGASMPVVLPAAQITTLTPPAAITGFALDATLTGRTQKTQLTDGTRDGTVKAASTLPALSDTAVVTTQRDPLPAGTNVIGHTINDGGSTTAVTGNVTAVQPTGTNLHTVVDSGAVTVTPPTLTKASQGATGFSTQDLKDAGRTAKSFYANNVASGTTTTETLITLTQSGGTAATTSASTYTITSGKTFRITALSVASRGSATATIQSTVFNLRLNTAGACVVTSTPILFAAQSATPATASAWDRVIIPIPDGYEIAGNGTIAICISAAATFVTNAPTWSVNLIGYEY